MELYGKDPHQQIQNGIPQHVSLNTSILFCSIEGSLNNMPVDCAGLEQQAIYQLERIDKNYNSHKQL